MKASVPATSEAVELLTRALSEGHTISLSLAAPPRVVQPPAPATACGLKFGMTPSQARILLALMEHGCVGREDLHGAMSVDGNAMSTIKTVDVAVHHMRRKLAGHGIEIETVWGVGYKPTRMTATRSRKLLDPSLQPDMK